MRAFASLAIACLLSGCAIPYMHTLPGSLRGYSESKLAADNYEIRFGTNGLNDKSFAAKAVLYRAAEVAKREGYANFQIYNANVALIYTSVSINYAPIASYRNGDQLTIYVKLVSGSNPPFPCRAERNDTCHIFVATEVLDNLGPIINGKH